MMLARLLYIVGGLLFLGSLVAHVVVRIRLRPSDDSELEDVYYEFEDEHPDYARYNQGLKITMAGAALGMLLVFVGMVF